MMKWLLGFGAIVLIAVGVGGYYLYSNLDQLIERSIEEYGTQSLGVPVRVARVALDLDTGRATISGVEVGNPPGFEGAQAITLAEILIDIELESIQDRNPIVLDELRIEAPIVFYEMNDARQSNLDVLRKNASRASADAKAEDSANSEGPPTRLRVKKLTTARGRVEAHANAISGKKLTADLATATLSDVGGRRGATGGEISVMILKELARQTAVAMGSGQVEKLLKDQIGDDAVDAVGGFLKRLRD